MIKSTKKKDFNSKSQSNKEDKSDDPLPCPFCGQVPRVLHRKFAENGYVIECFGPCNINPRTFCRQTKEEVIKLWNKRFK
jgi:hypothetical protein